MSSFDRQIDRQKHNNNLVEVLLTNIIQYNLKEFILYNKISGKSPEEYKNIIANYYLKKLKDDSKLLKKTLLLSIIKNYSCLDKNFSVYDFLSSNNLDDLLYKIQTEYKIDSLNLFYQNVLRDFCYLFEAQRYHNSIANIIGDLEGNSAFLQGTLGILFFTSSIYYLLSPSILIGVAPNLLACMGLVNIIDKVVKNIKILFSLYLIQSKDYSFLNDYFYQNNNLNNDILNNIDHIKTKSLKEDVLVSKGNQYVSYFLFSKLVTKFILNSIAIASFALMFVYPHAVVMCAAVNFLIIPAAKLFVECIEAYITLSKKNMNIPDLFVDVIIPVLEKFSANSLLGELKQIIGNMFNLSKFFLKFDFNNYNGIFYHVEELEYVNNTKIFPANKENDVKCKINDIFSTSDFKDQKPVLFVDQKNNCEFSIEQQFIKESVFGNDNKEIIKSRAGYFDTIYNSSLYVYDKITKHTNDLFFNKNSFLSGVEAEECVVIQNNIGHNTI